MTGLPTSAWRLRTGADNLQHGIASGCITNNPIIFGRPWPASGGASEGVQRLDGGAEFVVHWILSFRSGLRHHRCSAEVTRSLGLTAPGWI